MTRGCPTTVRGDLYPSIKAAAAAHGYSERQAQRHLDKFGHLDFLGVRLPRRRPDRHRSITIAGKVFESVTAAADTLGVDRKTIRNAEAGSRHARQLILRRAMEKSNGPTSRGT